MKVILLDIPVGSSAQRNQGSYINNFLDKNIFYFQIPVHLPKKDQGHLEKIAKEFFQDQITSPIERYLAIKEINFSGDIQTNSKEISWEIFFTFNQLITVNSNVFDDNLDWDISGFKGTIINFYSGDDQDIYQIRYSAESLRKIPIQKLKKISNTSSPFFTYLEPDYIMPEMSKFNSMQDQRDLVKLVENILDHLSFPPDVFSTIFETNSFLEIVQTWEGIFKSHSPQTHSIEVYLSNKNNYQLVEICGSDEFFGVWGNFVKENIHYLFPLTEIKKVINHRNFNNHIQSYKQIMKLILPN